VSRLPEVLGVRLHINPLPRAEFLPVRDEAVLLATEGKDRLVLGHLTSEQGVDMCCGLYEEGLRHLTQFCERFARDDLDPLDRVVCRLKHLKVS
jgi:hypothetical protein